MLHRLNRLPYYFSPAALCLLIQSACHCLEEGEECDELFGALLWTLLSAKANW